MDMNGTHCCALFGIKCSEHDAPQPSLLLLAKLAKLALRDVVDRYLPLSKDHRDPDQRSNNSERK
jgi:hypothetical protein